MYKKWESDVSHNQHINSINQEMIKKLQVTRSKVSLELMRRRGNIKRGVSGFYTSMVALHFRLTTDVGATFLSSHPSQCLTNAK